MNQDPIFAGTPLASLQSIVGQMCMPTLQPTWKDLPVNDPEVNAIDDAHAALEGLDHDAQVRVFRYLIARFGLGRELRNSV